MSKLVEATHVTLGGEIGSPDAWAHPYLDDEHMRYASEPAGAAARSPKLETRRQRRLELLVTLRRAREELGRWPTAGEWEASPLLIRWAGAAEDREPARPTVHPEPW
jgi:hypothetical protein